MARNEGEKLRLTKDDFNAGLPYSCWLREQMSCETWNHLHSRGGSKLIKKHHAHVDSDTVDFILNEVGKLDDYPGGLRKVAVDIIRRELDEDFEK